MMDNLPIDQNLPLEGTAKEIDPEEKLRKETAAKRLTILFAIVSVILVALIIWEIVDLSLGVVS